MPNGWNPGEVAIRTRVGYTKDPSAHYLYTMVEDDLDPSHAVFHTTSLPFLPVVVLDDEGRPWGSILAAEDGRAPKAGGRVFIKQVKYSTLRIETKIWPGDPLLDVVANTKVDKDGVVVPPKTDSTIQKVLNFAGAGDDGVLIAGIGVEYSTRRRNKFSGKITKLKRTEENRVSMELDVATSVGNCPKYITIRSLSGHPNTSPKIRYRFPHFPEKQRLPDDIISFILDSDTVFLGTHYKARTRDKMTHPSAAGINQRGGRPGWMRVKPSDGRTVVLPDWTGNRLLTSLGAIETTSRASLTYFNWVTGDVLYMTGIAKNLVGEEAKKVMSNQETLTEVYITGFTYVEDALPFRETPGTQPSRSPYNPPLKYLVEEEATMKIQRFSADEVVKATLAAIKLHSDSVATLSWEATEPLDIKPGQAIILDLKPFLGEKGYIPMAPNKPSVVNDDRIRTWTVSSASSAPSKHFELTMKLKEGGVATSVFFGLAHKLSEVKPELMADTRQIGLEVKVMGITGEFSVPSNESGTKKLLWIAGGVGFTPFVSMLKGISAQTAGGDWDIVLLLSTREPEVLIPMITEILAAAKGDVKVKFTLVVFSRVKYDQSGLELPETLDLQKHSQRLTAKFLAESSILEDAKEREAYLCGPAEFEDAVVQGFTQFGVPTDKMHREKFFY